MCFDCVMSECREDCDDAAQYRRDYDDESAFRPSSILRWRGRIDYAERVFLVAASEHGLL